VLLAATLLALAPGLASAEAAQGDEWPTTPDRGPGSPRKIPWLRFSGDPNASVVVVPERGVHAREVVIVREHEPLTARQRRLLRRAERHAEKAAVLRKKAGDRETRDRYAVVVPALSVVHAPPAPPAPPRPVVVQRATPEVHVVHVEHEEHEEHDEHEDCRDEDEGDDDDGHEHGPVVIDAGRISADIERQVAQALREADVERKVERALRQVERAREQTERARERAREQAREQVERARERAERDGERAREQAERGREQAERARERAQRAERAERDRQRGRR
jgi:hypothetical protein